MPSYKAHTLFALALSLIFFQNPLLISLAVISGNVPDFDHKFKKDSVYKIIILGLLIFTTLYILKLPSYIGLIIVFLGLTFHFSKHRSFTHSIFGVLTLTATLTLLIISAMSLISQITLIDNVYQIIIILIIFLSFIFLNKNISLIFIPLFIISVFLLPLNNLTYLNIIFSIFLGLLSHITLDSFTPSGIKLFAPISSKKFYKKFGVLMIILMICLSLFLFWIKI